MTEQRLYGQITSLQNNLERQSADYEKTISALERELASLKEEQK